MTQPGIEPRSSGSLANTLPTRTMSRLNVVQRSLIREFALYEFELSHNAAESQPKRFTLRKVKMQLITVQKQEISLRWKEPQRLDKVN